MFKIHKFIIFNLLLITIGVFGSNSLDSKLGKIPLMFLEHCKSSEISIDECVNLLQKFDINAHGYWSMQDLVMRHVCKTRYRVIQACVDIDEDQLDKALEKAGVDAIIALVDPEIINK